MNLQTLYWLATIFSAVLAINMPDSGFVEIFSAFVTLIFISSLRKYLTHHGIYIKNEIFSYVVYIGLFFGLAFSFNFTIYEFHSWTIETQTNKAILKQNRLNASAYEFRKDLSSQKLEIIEKITENKDFQDSISGTRAGGNTSK